MKVQAQNPSCVEFLLGVLAFSVPGFPRQQGVLGDRSHTDGRKSRENGRRGH